jgi:hypothetical protein
VDGRRFDQLARALAVGIKRRTLFKGMGGGLAGALGLRGRASAACTPFGRPCSGNANCCGGAVCSGGLCRCGAGKASCTSRGKITCVDACPSGQVLGADCQCRCAATGQPPTATGCPCLAGCSGTYGPTECCNGVCCSDFETCNTATLTCEGIR